MKNLSLKLLFLLVLIAIPVSTFAVQLNEIRIHQPEAFDSDEYFELRGLPGEDLSAVEFIVLTNTGMVLTQVNFQSRQIPDDGYVGIGEYNDWDMEDPHMCTGYDWYEPIPMSYPGGLMFPDTQNLTFLLVSLDGSGLPATEWGDDLDTDDDGVLDVIPWQEIIDSVAVVESSAGGGHIYSDTVVGPTSGGELPGHVILCDGVWCEGLLDTCVDDTIGAENDCSACSTSAVPGRSFGILLHDAHPNPFNPQTTLTFEFPQAADASLRVYDVTGRLVRTLLDDVAVKQGRNEVVWSGRDDSGRRVSSGVYFYSLESGGFAVTKQLVLIK